MAQAVFDSPIKEIKGEQVNVDANTAGYCALEPGFHEAILNCPDEDWLLLLNPPLIVLIFDGTSYTDYTSQATDKSSGTHVPLDALNGANGAMLYVGAPEPFGGIYFDIGTNIGNTAATMDWEYSSSATAFTDFAGSETDATNSSGVGPFEVDGAITWNAVPTGWHKASVSTYGGGDMYWARLKTSAKLNATVDINEMLTVNKGTDYGYFDKGEDYRFSMNVQKVGALQVLMAANSGDINVTWLKH